MKILKVNCPNCGASLEMDYERLMAFCPYCRADLAMDVDANHVVSEKEETKRKQLEEEARVAMNAKQEEAKIAMNAKREESKQVWILVPIIIMAIILMLFCK